MSQRQPSEQNYGSVRSPAHTERPAYQRQIPTRPQQTDRQLHGDSPTRHDVEFYVRKVNRYEVEIARLEHDLSVAKFKLSKAEDYEIKYELLFTQHQKTVTEFLDNRDELDKAKRDLDRARVEQENASQLIRNLRGEIGAEKRINQELRGKGQKQKDKSSSEGKEERDALKASLNLEIENIKRENRDLQEKFKREIEQLRGAIVNKETIESALAAKLQHIKGEKNQEIGRLKDLISELRNQLGQTHSSNEDRAIANREQLISETQDRIGNVRQLGQLIEETLLEQINNLNATLGKKNQEISFLIECDKRQLETHESSENALRQLVAKLQDKIFVIQRENQHELYSTIARLQAQYDENMSRANTEWEEIRLTHASAVDGLKRQIEEQKQEIGLLGHQNRNLQSQHKKLANDQQHSVQMLSQKIIAMQIEKDGELKNYTTSMKQIEDDAKTKLQDLHAAIQNKNSETDILNAQISLKNSQISHLLEELSRLRDVNRQKMKQLESINAAEQDGLNSEISAYKKQIFELRRNLHELESRSEDEEAEHQLQAAMFQQELQSQKEANQLLNSRNAFLAEWCGNLERDLKTERVSNVNILHDANISRRENVQLREQVRVELQAVKNKEVEQIRNVFKLEKGRLEGELTRREHELREKKEELGRLLVQYKALEAKVGKSSKVDRSAEDEGKCRATLQAEILLSENIFNAINRQ